MILDQFGSYLGKLSAPAHNYGLSFHGPVKDAATTVSLRYDAAEGKGCAEARAKPTKDAPSQCRKLAKEVLCRDRIKLFRQTHVCIHCAAVLSRLVRRLYAPAVHCASPGSKRQKKTKTAVVYME